MLIFKEVHVGINDFVSLNHYYEFNILFFQRKISLVLATLFYRSEGYSKMLKQTLHLTKEQEADVVDAQ